MERSTITEWKRIDLSKDRLDFANASSSELESDSNGYFISLTMKLKNGKTVRIRKNDYSVLLEEPVIPTFTKYLATTDKGLKHLFDSEDAANAALQGLDGDVKEVAVPVDDELPF